MPFLGTLNSIAVLCGGLLTLPLWLFVTRAGPHRALIAGALLNAAFLLTVALWPATWPLLIAAALTGPAAVLQQVSMAPFMMRHSGPAERDMLFSLNAGINIGVAGLGSLVGGFLPGLAVRFFDVAPQSGPAYQAAFGVAGMFVLLAVVPLLAIKDPPGYSAAAAPDTDGAPAPQPPQTGMASSPARRRLAALLRLVPEPWRSMIQRPWPVVRFLLSPLLISFGAALLIPYLTLYFRQHFGVTDEWLGAIFAAIGIVTGMATLAAPLLSARFGKMGSVVLTQALAIPCLLLLGFAPLLGLAVAAALVRGALMNMAAPLYDAYAMEHTAEAARPTIVGLINGAFAVGYIVGPVISTRVQQQYGFTPLFLATSVCYTLAALTTYVIFVRGGRRSGAQPQLAAASEEAS